MARGQTIFECIHGATPSTVEVLDIWNTSLIYKMLDAVWKAYDDLHGSSWPGVQWHESFDDLERSLTEQFAEAIRRNMDSNMPVYAEHKPAERESRSAPPAAPPEYDIAFKLRSDCRIMWPLEAKVLKSDKNTQDNLGDYATTLKDRYLTCKYAPFSSSGAMMGYMKSPEPENLATNIATQIGTNLQQSSDFPNRCHKTSDHVRDVPIGEPYPKNFRCHHLIMPLY